MDQFVHPLKNPVPEAVIARPIFNTDLEQIGVIRPRSVKEIPGSNWCLGCETVDRDYTDYHAYMEYLTPLGIPVARLQSGWAKTEKQPGVYDWAWMDAIVDDLRQRGMRPWLETAYGNPIYPGAGGWNLGAGMPHSREGLAAYSRYVEALVLRYRDRVWDWEVWNEPNFGDNKLNSPEATAEFNILTGAIIKKHQPEARISCLALGHINIDFVERFFRYLAERDACGLFDNVTYHDYVYNPDANKLAVYRLRQIVEKYAPGMKLRQGENGAPSVGNAGGALAEYPWTELSQAKWDARRMLENLGNDIQCSIFCIAEMQYDTSGPIKKPNVKGFLMTTRDLQVIRPKVAYYTVQHITSIFDDTLERLPGVQKLFAVDQTDGDCFAMSTDRSLSVYGYQQKGSDKRVYTIWRDDSIPANEYPVSSLDFSFAGSHFSDPVVVDIISGRVYALPAGRWERRDGLDVFHQIPVWDAPVLIAEKSLLAL